MDSLRRQRSQTTTEGDRTSTKDRGKVRNSFSKDTTLNYRTSVPSTSPTTPTGKSWMKFFSGYPTKHISSENINHSLELDITYITPRLIVMTTTQENSSSNKSSPSIVESIENFFDTKHQNHYTIYTLDQSSNEQLAQKNEFFHNKVIDLPLFDGQQSPRLIVLLWFCQKITSYLLESPSNIAVLHCINERNQLAFGSCSLLAYHRIFPRVDQILHYYQSKRCAHIFFTMSQKRYIQYLCDLSFDAIDRPHFNPITIKAIQLTPVPLVNRQRTGCRPFVDIYDQDEKKIFSTYQEIPKLKVYSAVDSHCLIPINLSFNGDLTIHLTHAAIGHSRQTHEGGIRICELTINSNFSTINHSDLSYLRNELDEIDQNEKHPTEFRLTIEIIHLSKEKFEHDDFFTEQLNKTLKQPLILFGDEQQLQKAIHHNDNQLFQQDIRENSSSIIHQRRKSKEGTISSTVPTSPTSFGFSNPLQSFINPRHPILPQQIESTGRTLSELFSSSSLIEENPTDDVPLLDLDINDDQTFSQSSKIEFQSTTSSNLLDDDFNFDLINPTTIISPTPFTIPKIEDKSSISTNPSNLNNSSDYQINSTVTQQQSPMSSTEKPKIDIYQYFVGVDGLGKDPKSSTESSMPNTIGAARTAAISKNIDPDVLKVRKWTEGKKGNLRALLCSLSTITWPECTWTGCQMHELLTDEQVKKVYRKAVLHIHPDRLRNDPNEELGKLIFMELNQAWTLFENNS